MWKSAASLFAAEINKLPNLKKYLKVSISSGNNTMLPHKAYFIIIIITYLPYPLGKQTSKVEGLTEL